MTVACRATVVATLLTGFFVGCGAGANAPTVARSQTNDEAKVELERLKSKFDELKKESEAKRPEVPPQDDVSQGRPKTLPAPLLDDRDLAPVTPKIPEVAPSLAADARLRRQIEETTTIAQNVRSYDPYASKAELEKLKALVEAAEMNAAWTTEQTSRIDQEIATAKKLARSHTQARDDIRNVFDAEFAQDTRPQRLALSAKLLGIARATNDNPVSRAVLYQEARRLAAEAPDLAAVEVVLEAMAAHFSIDKRSLRSKSLVLASRVVLEDPNAEPALHAEVARAAILASQAYSATNDFDEAAKQLEIAVRHENLAKDPLLQQTLHQQKSLLTAISAEFQKVKPAFEALRFDPTNRELNLAAGRFLCFVKDDWHAGLLLLAKGSDPDLAALASNDLADKRDSSAQVALGDGWWNVAETLDGQAKIQVSQRAAYWYKKGAAETTGFTRAKVLGRLKKLTNADAAEVEEQLAPGAFSGRESPAREKLLAKGGGTAQSEAAVSHSLEWLARVQSPTGAWSLTGKQNGCAYSNGSERENTSAATAMALLAFQGAGHTDKKGKFKNSVAKGWGYLLKQQTKDGCLADEDDRTVFYTHGQCTIALCDIYGMTKDPKYLDPARKAVEFCVNTQHRLGGWRYHVGEGGKSTDSDTSVTGWVAMGLQTASSAGLEVPGPVFTKVSMYLDKAKRNGGSLYGYQADSSESEAMTAEGLLCRQYLGWRPDNPILNAGADYLLGKLPTYNGDGRNVYYWYHATQVMHHMEGARWTKWNSAMRDLLISKQEKTGAEKGSWDPIKPTPDKYGAEAGRLFVTCLSTYILEVYYRHPPLYAQLPP